MKLRESIIWLGRDLEVMTQLLLTTQILYWKTIKSEFLIPLEFIIGCVISECMSRSFKLMVFDASSNKFLIHEFSAISSQQAQQWCDLITSTANSPPKRHLCIIVNPICGNRSSKKVLNKSFLPVLDYSPHTYDCFVTTHQDFVDDLIHRRDFAVYTDVICLGGDGTFQQVLNGINKHQSPLMSRLNFGVLPVGSRNALACELNGKNLNTAIFNIVKCVRFVGDLMRIGIGSEEILATTAVSWGLVSDACDEAQHLRIFGAHRDNVVAFKKFFQKWKQYAGVVSFEDSLGQMISFRSDYVMVNVSNHRVPNSHNAEILMPNARINNGKLDLLLMFFTSKFKTLGTLMMMQKNGAHIKSKHVNMISTNIVIIEPANLMVFNVDGEIHYTNKLTIQVLPQSISYLGKPEYV